MRYLFAAVIAVFAFAVDLESSDIRSAWREPSFVVAEAQSEPATTSSSQTGIVAASTATASIEYPQTLDATNVTGVPAETTADAAVHAAASFYDEAESPDPICEAVRTAAEENDIPIGFLARLLWQESRFRAEEVSSAGAQGIAQFMPQTAVEMGLQNPFDPLQAIPVAAKFLRKLHDQFGNLGLAAAAYNAGGGRIEKWLSRRSTLPQETRAYVKIITGHKAEMWTDEENTIYMPTELPHKAPCEGVGGLSRQDQIATVNVDLTPSASAMVRKAETDEAEDRKNAAARKLRVAESSAARRGGAAARKTNARAALLASKGSARKQAKQAVTRLAADSSSAGRTKSSRGAREL
jgi:hypothetical protein